VTKKKVGKHRTRRTITATVRPPAGVTAAEACGEGTITFVVDRDDVPFINTQRALKANCTASVSFDVKAKGKKAKKKKRSPDYSVDARFSGNSVLLPASTSRRFA